jgi:SagB-type dehydrogenase family enzyme
VEEALLGRRSVREYSSKAVTLQQLGQLLWAAQGITGTGGKRTAPSAGGLYPLEVYVVAGNVEGIEQGIYRYRPATHDLAKMVDGDMREALAGAALDQVYVKQAALDIVITAVYARTTGKYGDRGKTYVHMEAGHAAENICLEAVALKLGTVTIGAFEDDRVKKVLTCPEDEIPLYVLPVGNPID